MIKAVNMSWKNWEGKLNSNQLNLGGSLGSDGTRVSSRSTNRTSANSCGFINGISLRGKK